MKWSDAWFQGFRRRFNISLRCKTKRAQKSLEDPRRTIQNWLQFNRRNTVVLEGSDCGNLSSPEVEATRIGSFLPCDVPVPLAFEPTTTGGTYAKKGEHTVFLRSGPSGWGKRNCTLMIAVSADGLPHIKPAIMYGGAESIGKRPRQLEMKKYHPAVHVVFNPKAYCNSTALLNWFRQQLKWGSPSSPDDHEPKLLVLDSFAPHKNSGTKKVATTPAAKVKAVAEQAVRKALKYELEAQNITSSIIPGGCTAHIQPRDISVNKLIKGLIRDQEDHWEDHLEE